MWGQSVRSFFCKSTKNCVNLHCQSPEKPRHTYFRLCSSTNRIKDSGSLDQGLIPCGGTKNRARKQAGPIFFHLPQGRPSVIRMEVQCRAKLSFVSGGQLSGAPVGQLSGGRSSGIQSVSYTEGSRVEPRRSLIRMEVQCRVQIPAPRFFLRFFGKFLSSPIIIVNFA